MIVCITVMPMALRGQDTVRTRDTVRALDEVLVRDARVGERSPFGTSTLSKEQLAERKTEVSVPYMLELQPSVVVAGENGKMVREMLTEAWSYSASGGWRRLSHLPHFCGAAPTPCPVINGHIYLLGGDDATVKGFTPANHPGFHNQSLCYSPARDAWSEAGTIAAARAVLPCAEWNGLAVIVNGEQRPGKRSNEVWAAKMH